MEWSAENLAKARALLAEDACTLVLLRHSRRRRMTRKWPRVPDTDRALCEAYLAEFASAANAEKGRFVFGPKVDGGRETFPGRWKMVKTELTPTKTDPNGQGVYQTLVEWPEGETDADGDFCAESSPLHHEDTEIRYDASEPFSCGHAIEPGFIFHASASWNDEDGCWVTEKRTDKARDPGRYAAHSATALERSTTTKGEHQPLSAVPSMAEVEHAAERNHQTIRWSADMDNFGLLSTAETVGEGKPWSITAVTEEPTETVRTTRFGNQPSPPADKGPVTGPDGRVTITQNAATPNEYGLFDGQTVERTSKAGSVSYTAAAGKYSTATVTHCWNKISVPNATSGYVAGDPGKYVERAVSGVRLNDFGLWDYTLTETTTTCSVSGRNYVTKGKGRWHKLIYGYNVSAIPAGGNTDPNALVNPDGESVRTPIYGLVETAEKHWVRTKVFTDEAAAYSWIAGGALDSHVSQVDGHWFLAVRVDHSAQAGVNYQGA